MISLKKVIVAAAVATLSFGLFAQSSKTNAATAGLFDTDVDNFVNVNEWSTVKPEKFFGYFGMDNGYYNVGFAKQFEKFYWGTYYDGDIGASEKKTNDNTKVTTDKNDNGYVYFANLFGFGNVGLRVNLSFSGNKDVEDNGETKITTTKDSTVFFGEVDVGLSNYQLGKFNTKPFAYVNFNTNNNYGTKTEVTHADTKDTRRKSFGLGAGAEVTISETETTKQTVSGYVNFTNYTPYDSDLASKGTNFYIPLTYKVTYNASENLALAFSAGATTSYNTSDNSKAKTKTANFYFTPSVSTGLTFDTKKKVILNAGLKFAVPSYSDEKTDTDGKVIETAGWSGTDCNLTWTSGFNWVPTKNISVDCTYQILRNLIDNRGADGNNSYDNMETDLSEGNGTSIWNTLNQVLVHNIGFSVSVKF